MMEDNRLVSSSYSAAAAGRLQKAFWVYDNWSSYTDGNYWRDDTRNTEALALCQLSEIRRLRTLGVQIDAFMMNGFWADADGGYRHWRQENWPQGPERWIQGCQAEGVVPGLWFGLALWGMNSWPAWQDSIDDRPDSEWPFPSLSMSEGGFLDDFKEILNLWYDCGIRLFEIDMTNLLASRDPRRSSEAALEANTSALHGLLSDFRSTRADVLVVGFNDFGGNIGSTSAGLPFKREVDKRWLDVFETLYSGDTRLSDVPSGSLWRSIDLYTSHMVRGFEMAGIPLPRIDSLAFTLSTTAFGYRRGKAAWKSMALLNAAHGGWKQTIYGDLGLLSDEDARWLGKLQRLYAPLLERAGTFSFGGVPGDSEPFGFASPGEGGMLLTVVNPSFSAERVELPIGDVSAGRILFRERGFEPQLQDNYILMGAGQMVVLGFGAYSSPKYDLGRDDDIAIPVSIVEVESVFHPAGRNAIEAQVATPACDELWIVMQQRDSTGQLVRTADRRTRKTSDVDLGPIMLLEARHHGHRVFVRNEQDAVQILFGTSWTLGKIDGGDLLKDYPLTVRCVSTDDRELLLEAKVLAVVFGSGNANEG